MQYAPSFATAQYRLALLLWLCFALADDIKFWHDALVAKLQLHDDMIVPHMYSRGTMTVCAARVDIESIAQLKCPGRDITLKSQTLTALEQQKMHRLACREESRGKRKSCFV